MTGKSAPHRGGQLRIIGGEWRGRKLRFPAVAGLRPTPDRVRETLFNWLAAEVPGARCLDLFAGSGALGLEALSRGAAHCDFVEQNRSGARAIEQHLRTLGCGRGRVWCAEARRWLGRAGTDNGPDNGPDNGSDNSPDYGPHDGPYGGPYNIVFLDPPFDRNLIAPVCAALEERKLLAPAAHIYMETGARRGAPRIPGHWLPLREQRAGEVKYGVFTRRGQLG